MNKLLISLFIRVSPNQVYLKKSGNYTAVRKDRPGETGGGELFTLIHRSIPFINILSDSIFPSDDITDHLSITAIINNVPVNIHNIYIPLYPVVPPISHLTFTFFLTSVITTISWETSTPIALPGTLTQQVHLWRQRAL